jgi:folate-binding protein YgfZ
MTNITRLTGRGVVAVSGPDRTQFLNGLVSNDVAKVAPGQAVWAAMLTAQGRYLTDFFILEDEQTLLLDTPADFLPELVKRFSRYKLRAAVAVEDASEKYAVYAAWGGLPPAVPVTAADPRLPEAGFRMLSTEPLEETASQVGYDAHRLDLGLPDGPPDLEPDKTLLLEAGFDELNGVDWKKGCYMGQELTARTKYRGLVKRRLVPVNLEANVPAGTPVLADGHEVGTIRSSAGPLALAMLRVDALAKHLIAGSSLVQPRLPPWLMIPA